MEPGGSHSVFGRRWTRTVASLCWRRRADARPRGRIEPGALLAVIPPRRSLLRVLRTTTEAGLYLAALDSPDAKLLLPDYVSVAYSPPGYLLALIGSSRGAPGATLMAQPFDPARRQLTGDPSPVAEQIAYANGLGRGAFSVSDNGPPRVQKR